MPLQVRSLDALARLLAYQGRIDEARGAIGKAVELARNGGWLARLPVLLVSGSYVEILAGELDTARTSLREAIRISRELGTSWGEMVGGYRLALCELLEGRVEGLDEALGKVAETARRADSQVVGSGGLLLSLWSRAIEEPTLSVRAEIRRIGADPRMLLVHPDVALFFESTAALASERGQADEAVWLRDLAVEYWSSCGNHDRAERVSRA